MGGTGIVLDVSSNKPIPNASIRLECKRNLLHGSTKVKDITVTTDSLGRFDFDSQQLSDCDFAYVHAKKTGYIETKKSDIRYLNTAYKNLPQKVYMSPIASSRMQHLQFLNALASGSSVSKKHEYLNIYTQFYASKRIAESVQEIQYVRSQYCNRLLTLYDDLADSDKSWLKQKTVQYSWNNTINYGKVDNLKEVIEICKSP